MILISNLILEVLEGSTIASTEIYGTDKKTYINIGSGNVFKLKWETPTLTNDTVDHYSLVIKRHDTVLNVYYDIFNKNIGLVNEFYVDSPMLPPLPEQYKLSIYVVVHGKQDSIITSNVVTPYISKGSGTYIKVEDGYNQPIMKRVLAITKGLPVLADLEGNVLTDAEGNILMVTGLTNEYILNDRTGQSLLDASGHPLIAVATKVLNPINDWVVVQEVYTKDSDSWRINDIEFEALVDENGEVIECLNNGSYEPIYVQ